MKKIVIGISVIILILIITFITLYVIDMNRIKNNKQVIFSTWGYDYYPPVSFDEEQINSVIHDYIIFNNEIKSSGHEGRKWFTSIKTYLIDEKDETKTLVYAWVLEKSYYKNGKNIVEDSGTSIPYKFTLQKVNGSYQIIDYEIPRDGTYYNEDIKTMFPEDVLNNMYKIYSDGTIHLLEEDIKMQAKEYFDSLNENRLELSDICNMVAQKKEKLTWSDFEKYTSIDVGSGLYILLYEIDENYRLLIGGIPTAEPMYIKLVAIKDNERSIDIRYDNIEEFLNTTN